MQKIARYALLIAFTLGLTIGAHASRQLNPADAAFVVEVERYLNAMRNISGEFTQVSSNGHTDAGRFFIRRPGRMRLEYESPMLLIADGESLVFHDQRLNQISFLPLSAQPAAVILQENASFSDPGAGITIHEVRHHPDGRTSIVLGHEHSRQAGNMSLIFNTSPLSISGWRVRDAHGVTTDVTLHNIQESPTPLPDSLFRIQRRGAFGAGRTRFY